MFVKLCRYFKTISYQYRLAYNDSFRKYKHFKEPFSNFDKIFTQFEIYKNSHKKTPIAFEHLKLLLLFYVSIPIKYLRLFVPLLRESSWDCSSRKATFFFFVFIQCFQYKCTHRYGQCSWSNNIIYDKLSQYFYRLQL